MEEEKIHELLRRMAEGDEKAFTELYTETRHDVYRIIAFLIPDPHDAVEVASEVYIQLWKSYRTYDFNRSFRSWLHGIAVRLASSHRRKLFKRLRLFEKQKQLHVPVTQTIDESWIGHDELVQNMMRLSRKLRTIVVLRYFHDYTFYEIATILNIPDGTVKSRHHAALKKLREAWTPISNEEVEDSNEYRAPHSHVVKALRRND